MTVEWESAAPIIATRRVLGHRRERTWGRLAGRLWSGRVANVALEGERSGDEAQERKDGKPVDHRDSTPSLRTHISIASPLAIPGMRQRSHWAWPALPSPPPMLYRPAPPKCRLGRGPGWS
jgi:hypothetical protein